MMNRNQTKDGTTVCRPALIAVTGGALIRIAFLVLVCFPFAFGAPLHAADKTSDCPVGWPAMERMDLLPLLAPNGTQTKQFISYDTSGGNDSRFEFFRRYEQDGEWVFFDEIGPGALYRLQMNIWRGDPLIDQATRIRFRFDNEKQPRIDMTFNEFFGYKDQYTAPFTPPLAYFAQQQMYAILYHPFTFAKRLQISAYHPKIRGWGTTWYQFTYLKFPSGTKTQTWAGRDEDSPTLRKQWEAKGADPKPARNRRTISHSGPLTNGQSVVILDEKGSGNIAAMKFALVPWNRDTFHNVRLRVTYDGHTAPLIDLPIGCFVGGGGDGIGKDMSRMSLQTLMFGYDGKAGTGYSYWPMPFWNRALIEITNASGVDLTNLTVSAELEDSNTMAYPADRSGYLAVTRTQKKAGPQSYYLPAYYQRGHGKVVGLMMYSLDYHMDGDEFTYIDGSKTPQIHGNGTEDDHNQGWGGYAVQKPWWGGLINGYDGSYRLYLADAYVFNSEIRVNYELFFRNPKVQTDFIVWSYLGTPGIGNLTLTDTLDVGDATSETEHQYRVDGEVWSGKTTSSYDRYMAGDPYPTADTGRAFTNATQFVMRIHPDNNGVRLRRRLNRHMAHVQLAKVFVNGQEIADTPWYFCDLRTPATTAFADSDFEIPAPITRGKKQITIRLQHLSAQPANANNEYRYEAYCYGRNPLPPLPPAPPESVTAVLGSNDVVNISWVAGAETPAETFEIERQTHGEPNFKPLARLPAAATHFTDKTVANLETYHYRVRAAGPGGPSDWVATTTSVIIPPSGQNLLRQAVATASSEWADLQAAGKANDGDWETRWNSAQGALTNQWLAFRLPVPKPINTVVIHQTTTWTRITDYRIQVMQDGTWRDVYQGGEMPDQVVCRFNTVTTDQLRIWIGKTTGNTPTLNEVLAYCETPIRE